MTEDGASEQPVTEAQPSAPALPPAPAADALIAEAPSPAASETAADALPVDAPPAETMPPAEPAAMAEPPPVEVSVPTGPLSSEAAPQETPAEAAAEPLSTPAPPIAEPLPAVAPPAAVAPIVVRAPRHAPRGTGPMLGFAAWRLVELVVTVAVAAVVFVVALPAATLVDLGVLGERLAVTVPLVVLALLLAVVGGLPVGYAAARTGSWVDVGLRALATLGAGLAPVWLAMLLVLLFSTTLRWLQPGGFVPWQQSPLGALTSLVLPALALGLPLAADLALRMRDALRVAQTDPAIRSAEMMGLTGAQAVRRHAVRNALADLAPRAALPLALLVPGSLVIENVFYLPGLGRLVFSALEAGDFATLHVGLIALVALIALTRFLVQLLHAMADPRLARRA